MKKLLSTIIIYLLITCLLCPILLTGCSDDVSDRDEAIEYHGEFFGKISKFLLSLFIEPLKVTDVPDLRVEPEYDSDNDEVTDVERYENSYNFLIVAKDRMVLNTDVIMLVNLDMSDQGSLTVVQLPRDTLVNYNGSVRKLNSVYSVCYNSSSVTNEEERVKDSMQAFSDFIAESFAIKIDHYVQMDPDGFGRIVDTIGGVDMYVPYRMQYKDENQNPPLNIDLYEGQQTLNGEQAEHFVRFRSSYINGDLGRLDAQKLFMSAFLESFKNKVSLSKIPSVVAAMTESITCSLDLDDAVYFVRQITEIDTSEITMLTAPNTPVEYYGSYVVLHRNAMYDIINKYFNMFSVDIPDESFDANKSFTVEDNKNIEAIYNSNFEYDSGYTVEEILDNGIEIPRAW